MPEPFRRLTWIAQACLKAHLRHGDWAVDATMGNGYDTRWLAECVGPMGRVFGFDVQSRSIEITRSRCAGVSNVTFIRASHVMMREYVPGPVRAVVFNLGYLPGGDRTTTTQPATTLTALRLAADILAPGGALSVLAYRNQPGGGAEHEAVLAHCTEFEQRGWMLRLQHSGTVERPGPTLAWLTKPHPPT